MVELEWRLLIREGREEVAVGLEADRMSLDGIPVICNCLSIGIFF